MSTGSGSLAVGELFGAAGFITSVVAGSMALVRPFKVAKKSFIRDVGFFTVAAVFSIYFLHDGKLYYWECCVMVGFYIFYVLFVVFSHWWSDRKRKLREAEVIARGHFFVPSINGEIEEYRDDEEDEDRGMGSRSSTGRSMEDFAALERGGHYQEESIAEEDEETRNMLLGELNRNMRITRPTLRHRRSMSKPIRPSLVGALEFRAVLSSLQRSANIQPVQLNTRRYTDEEPTITLTRRASHLSTVSDPMMLNVTDSHEDSRYLSVGGSNAYMQSGGRIRAVSTGDSERVRYDPERLQSIQQPLAKQQRYSEEEEPHKLQQHFNEQLSQTSGSISKRLHATSPSLAPPSEHLHSGSFPSLIDPDSIESRQERRSDSTRKPGVPLSRTDSGKSGNSSFISPLIQINDHDRNYPKITIPTTSGRSSGTASPFPAYNDHASPIQINLPPNLFPEAAYINENVVGGQDKRPPRWWPSRFLPPPTVLYAKLFPTIFNWRMKTWWEKLLGLVSAPSVFLLTITLPVVESSSDEPAEDAVATDSPHKHISNEHRRNLSEAHTNGSQDQGALLPPIINVNDADEPSGSEDSQDWKSRTSESTNVPTREVGGMHSPSPEPEDDSNSAKDTASSPPSLSDDWHWWLVVVQIFCAPLFIVVVVWTNINRDASAVSLVRLMLISLLSSLCILAIILGTTNITNRPPHWRFLLCFVGFVVSIAWISTIANEVVGVIKTIGVVLDMSDAILGLTVFAVGNSLGDLVANITVARLGYPVMALSACFGGPMLNILLGIGLSGLYLSLRRARDRQDRHPHRKLELEPYDIHISSTLLISGVTLLVTLLALLVAVPARQWRMDKWIGWGLVLLWVLSTGVNVILEVVRV